MSASTALQETQLPALIPRDVLFGNKDSQPINVDSLCYQSDWAGALYVLDRLRVQY